MQAKTTKMASGARAGRAARSVPAKAGPNQPPPDGGSSLQTAVAGDASAAKPAPAASEHCVVPYNPAGSTGAAPPSPIDAKLRAIEAHVVARRGKVIQGQIELAELAESMRRLQEEAESKLGQLRASYRRKSEDLTDEKARLDAEEALLKALKE